MSKSKISIIIKKEYISRVKKRSFILLTLLTPLLLGATFVVPILIVTFSDNEKSTLMVSDNSGIVMPYFKNTESVSYLDVGALDIDGAKNLFDAESGTPVVYISPLDSAKNLSIAIFASKQVNIDMQMRIAKAANKAVEDNKLQSYNIPNLSDIMNDIKSDVNIKTYEIGDNGDAKESKVEISMAIGYISSFLIYMFVFMFGGMVMRSVIEEKSSRVVEVIVSSVKPMQMMMGKIIGVALVAITQFSIWIILTGAIIVGGSMAFGNDLKESISQSSQNQMIAGSALSQDMPSVQSIQDTLSSSEDGDMLQSYFNAVKQVNYIKILVVFVIYFILGYLLYSSMFAAIGAACDNESDTQQLTLPITVPLIIGLYIMLHSFQYPDSSLSFWGSIIPFTSPMVMMARISYGVPFWELALSIVVMICTFLFIAYLSSKIYRVGILMYGKKNGWKEIFKWISNK